MECSPIHEAITHDFTFRRNDGDDFDVLIISARREVNIFELKIQQQLSDVSELWVMDHGIKIKSQYWMKKTG